MTAEHPAINALGAEFADHLCSRAARAGGEVIIAGASDFDRARRVYNRLHDPRPIALVRTLDPGLAFETAQACEAFGLPLAVRGGGHHIGGGSGGDGGIVLDFSPFRRVEYCPRTQICRVQPGARLADIDRELSSYGRVIPTGTVSDTGIAGLTLGGGIGWLTGLLGLTCDHLVGADVLLADGRVVRAEDGDPSSVLWALRGGGGVGVVLELRFRTAALPVMAAGSVLVDRGIEAVLIRLFGYLGFQCPRELTVAPILGRGDDGRNLLRVEYCSAGGDGRGVEDLLHLLPDGTWGPFRGSFVQWQAHLDAAFLPPQRGYWKACHLRAVTAANVSAMVQAVSHAPSARCSIIIEHLHGAFAEAAEESSAFPLRKARFGVLFAARWPDGEDDAENVGWVLEGYNRLDPGGSRPVYANYALARDPRAASSFSPSTRERLRELRSRYDFAALSPRPGALEEVPNAGARQ